MEFSKLIQARFSVRSYQPVPVEEEKVQAVLEAARLAPTAANKQPFKIYVIPTADHKEELLKVCSPPWFVEAPLVLAIAGRRDACWVRKHDGRSYLDVDVAIAMDHLILAAADQGLGTCWIGMFHSDAARELLKIGAELEPIVFTPLGYPAEQAPPKRRRPLAELVVDLRR